MPAHLRHSIFSCDPLHHASGDEAASRFGSFKACLPLLLSVHQNVISCGADVIISHGRVVAGSQPNDILISVVGDAVSITRVATRKKSALLLAGLTLKTQLKCLHIGPHEAGWVILRANHVAIA